MANDNTPEAATSAPAKRGRPKKVNLATAKVADGALESPKSIYEICGIASHSYNTSNLEEYKRSISSLNLMQLQEEAYNKGILPTDSREMLLDRLERKFIGEVSKFKTSKGQTFESKDTPAEALRREALNILSRGK